MKNFLLLASLAVVGALALTSGCANPVITDPQGGQPTAEAEPADPMTPAGNSGEKGPSPAVQQLVNQLEQNNALPADAPTTEQAKALAQAVFEAIRNHDRDAALSHNMDENDVRAVYKPSVASIMAPGVRARGERKWLDIERITFEREVHLDRVEVGDLIAFDPSSTHRRRSHQFPHVQLHLLVEEAPVVVTLGQVMRVNGKLRYLTLDVGRP